ncbi:hypothetical protein EJ110_NYTH42789 [Nymphaea thermarum]|nr:hypothetical protein EJ110_NYTH42789 [Nymphaea thermarum]
MSMELERPLCIAEGQLYYSEPPGAALIVSFPLLLKDFHKKSMGDSVIGSDKICISSDPYEWTSCISTTEVAAGLSNGVSLYIVNCFLLL